MLLAITYVFPGLSGVISTAFRALIWSIVLLVSVALVAAVVVAVLPYLPQLMVAAAVICGFARLTYPRPRKAVGL